MLSISCVVFFFSSRRRHTRLTCDWSSDVCSSDLRFNFSNCGFEKLMTTHKVYCDVLSAVTPDARDRWDAFTAEGSADAPVIADALNLLTAMRSIQLAVGTPIDYLRAVRWDGEF